VNVSVVDPTGSAHDGVENAPPLDAPSRGEGTGFLVDPEGYILTNQHLAKGTSRIRVRFADRTERPARLVGADESTDIALIKVEGGRFPVVPLGDSDRLRVGDWVCAIGNPYSFDHTVTAGVVSSKGRKIFNASFDAYIQTDAAINPGNSGGPLLNAAGEAIGISTAVSTEGQGIGFAVPINLARSVMEQLRSRGRVSRGCKRRSTRARRPSARAWSAASNASWSRGLRARIPRNWPAAPATTVSSIFPAPAVWSASWSTCASAPHWRTRCAAK